MKTYWHLEVSFPLEQDMAADETSKVIKIVNKEPSDSGEGFGMRDVGWTFDDELAARAAYNRLRNTGYTQVSCGEYER